MSNEFGKWAEENLMYGGDKWAAEAGWYARQSEIDSLRRKLSMTEKAHKIVIRQRDNIKAENERLRKDAERYRWLRDPCVDIRPIIKYQRGDYGWGLWTHKALDETIDAAMKDFSTTTKEE